MHYDAPTIIPGEDSLTRMARTTLGERLARALADGIHGPVADLPQIDTPLRAFVVHLKQHGALPEHALMQVREAARRTSDEQRQTTHAEWTDPDMFVSHVERRCFRAYYRAD